jgi:hypothetical protein
VRCRRGAAERVDCRMPRNARGDDLRAARYMVRHLRRCIKKQTQKRKRLRENEGPAAYQTSGRTWKCRGFLNPGSKFRGPQIVLASHWLNSSICPTFQAVIRGSIGNQNRVDFASLASHASLFGSIGECNPYPGTSYTKFSSILPPSADCLPGDVVVA